jgi:hypothetical protein
VLIRAEQRRADARVDAVSADDDIRLDLAAVLELGDGEVTVRLGAGTAGPEGDAPRRQGGRDQVKQIRAMDRRAAETERRCLLRAADLRDDASRPPVARRQILGATGDPADRILHADHPEHPHRVGVQRHARTDLPELGRRLVDRHLEPRPRQGATRRAATDPATDDRHARQARTSDFSSSRLSRTRVGGASGGAFAR